MMLRSPQILCLAMAVLWNAIGRAQEPSTPTASPSGRAILPKQSPKASAPTVSDLNGTPELAIGKRYIANDSLSVGTESNADAEECLRGLCWEPTQFEVMLEEGVAEQRVERLVRFASPMPLGNSVNDRVAMEWHVAFDDQGKPKRAPAMIVVHESGRQMTAGRMIAKGLRAHGLHAFMLQMPGYGVRESAQDNGIEQFLPGMKQAISDVRRARDAVAALPFVDDSLIGVQGTSLGGFVTATVGGLDQGYDRVFILLAGGNLNKVIFEGAKDAAAVRQRLEAGGATKEKIMESIRPIEPLRIAHRIRPEVTWLYSGKFDDVVPPACSIALADAAKLAEDHHVQMPVDHYSGAILMPKIVMEMAQAMKGKAQ